MSCAIRRNGGAFDERAHRQASIFTASRTRPTPPASGQPEISNNVCVLLCFIDPRARKIGNEASSCTCLFVCFFVGIKPEKLYSNSYVALGSSPLRTLRVTALRPSRVPWLNEVAEIPVFHTNLNDVLGNFWESVGNQKFVPKKEVCCRAHVNEQLSCNSWETRIECKWITAAHAVLCWCTAVSALGHLHSPCVETRRHD